LRSADEGVQGRYAKNFALPRSGRFVRDDTMGKGRRSAARSVGAPERGARWGTSVCRECETARHRGGLRKVRGHLYWQYRAVWCRTASRRRGPRRAGSSSFALNGKRTRRIRASGRKLGWPKRWELLYARSRRGRLATRCRAPSTAAGSPRFSASASRTWDSEAWPGGVGSDAAQRSAQTLAVRSNCASVGETGLEPATPGPPD